MKDTTAMLVFSGCLLVAASGCRKESAGKVESSPPPSSATKRRDKPPPLEAQLASEAQSRTSGALSAEQILSALARADVKVADPRQEIATVHRARFCIGGSTEKGLAISVCEYDSEQAARAGREHSLKMFAAIPNREIFVHGRAALILRADHMPAGKHADARRAIEALQRLPKEQ